MKKTSNYYLLATKSGHRKSKMKTAIIMMSQLCPHMTQCSSTIHLAQTACGRTCDIKLEIKNPPPDGNLEPSSQDQKNMESDSSVQHRCKPYHYRNIPMPYILTVPYRNVFLLKIRIQLQKPSSSIPHKTRIMNIPKIVHTFNLMNKLSFQIHARYGLINK